MTINMSELEQLYMEIGHRIVGGIYCPGDLIDGAPRLIPGRQEGCIMPFEGDLLIMCSHCWLGHLPDPTPTVEDEAAAIIDGAKASMLCTEETDGI